MFSKRKIKGLLYTPLGISISSSVRIVSKKGFYSTKCDQENPSKENVVPTTSYQPHFTGAGESFFYKVNPFLLVLIFFSFFFCLSLLLTLFFELFSSDWTYLSSTQEALKISVEYQENLFQEELKNARDLHGDNPELLEKELASCREIHGKELNLIHQTFDRISKK